MISSAAPLHNDTMKLRLRWVIATLLYCALDASAHHSIAGVYDRNRPLMLDAVVTEFHLVNPHPFLIVSATAGGQSDRWKLELDNRSELVDVGVTADTFRPGDHVSVRGIPARDGSRQLYATRIERPADQFWYEQIGSSPKVGYRR
jgi:hypothetical protein